MSVGSPKTYLVATEQHSAAYAPVTIGPGRPGRNSWRPSAAARLLFRHAPGERCGAVSQSARPCFEFAGSSRFARPTAQARTPKRTVNSEPAGYVCTMPELYPCIMQEDATLGNTGPDAGKARASSFRSFRHGPLVAKARQGEARPGHPNLVDRVRCVTHFARRRRAVSTRAFGVATIARSKVPCSGCAA
jgi:hypothetical protein